MKTYQITLALIIFALSQPSKGQLLNDYSNYGESSLDTSKWTLSEFYVFPNDLTTTYSNLGPRFEKTGTGTSPYPHTVFLTYNTPLPTNQDWTLLQRFKIEPNTGMGSAFIQVYNNDFSLVDKFIKYDSDIWSNKAGFSSTYGNMNDNPSNYDFVSENNSFKWIALSFNNSTKELKTLFSNSDQEATPDAQSFITQSTSLIDNTVADVNVRTGANLYYGAIQFGAFNLVPEPSALSLLAVGLGGLAILRRRRS